MDTKNYPSGIILYYHLAIHLMLFPVEEEILKQYQESRGCEPGAQSKAVAALTIQLEASSKQVAAAGKFTSRAKKGKESQAKKSSR